MRIQKDMKPRTQKSIELYNTLLNRGFPQEFCEQISLNLNTDWTAQRMLGYLSAFTSMISFFALNVAASFCFLLFSTCFPIYTCSISLQNQTNPYPFSSQYCFAFFRKFSSSAFVSKLSQSKQYITLDWFFLEAALYCEIRFIHGRQMATIHLQNYTETVW